jgi:Ala-tRNA(Pro) deacylase
MEKDKISRMGKVEKKILELLRKQNISFQEIKHDPVFTMEQAEEVCKHKTEEGVKTLLIRGENGVLALAVLRGDHRLDFGAARKSLKSKRISFGDETDLGEIGVSTGGLSPFGYDQSLPVILDRTIAETDFSYINPGDNTKTIKLRSGDLVSAIRFWAKEIFDI